jgi:shikimate kinase
MATGKSRIGRALALYLDRPFYDTDEMIETRAGKPVSRIFAEDGEDAFRQLETECVADVVCRPEAVVALGGGAITRHENRDIIAASAAVVVCVQANIETILERVSRRDDRPLLTGLSHEEKRDKVKAMLQERAPHYATAHITVQSTERSHADDLARDLAARLEAIT